MFEGLREKFGFTEGDNASIDIELRHKKQMNFMTLVVAVLLFAIGLLGMSYSTVVDKMNVNIELPPTMFKEPSIKVGNGWSNDLYMKVWGDWFVNSTANFTPGTVKESFNEAMRFFSQDKVSDYAGQFGALNNLIIRNQLKQTFVVKNFEATYYEDTDMHDRASDDQKIKGAVLVYSGVATQTLGTSPMPDRNCKYTVSIKLEGGHLYGNSYDTDCFK